MSSLLWKIESERTQPSFIFGSIHISHQQLESFQESLFRFIPLVDCFAAEVDLDPGVSPRVHSYLLLPEDEPLDKIIDAHHWNKLKLSARKYFDIDLNEFKQFFPIVLIMQLSTTCLSNCDKAFLDLALWNYAHQLNIKTSGLESIDEHYGMISKIGLEYQIKAMKDMLLNASGFKRKLAVQLEYYIKQDLAGIHRLIRKQSGGFRHLLIHYRNQNMVTALINLMNDNSVFCSVGVGHLYGKYGMLNLLKQKGFHIKQIGI